MGVAPHAGARIETGKSGSGHCCPGSPPTRGRGLKPFRYYWESLQANQVAPHAGARIETVTYLKRHTAFAVAPHAGARIET